MSGTPTLTKPVSRENLDLLFNFIWVSNAHCGQVELDGIDDFDQILGCVVTYLVKHGHLVVNEDAAQQKKV